MFAPVPFIHMVQFDIQDNRLDSIEPAVDAFDFMDVLLEGTMVGE